MLQNYIRIAWRHLSRNSVYSIINILGLAIGISACLTIYLIANYELSYDRFHPDKERIFRAVSTRLNTGTGQPFYINTISHAASHIIRDEYPGVEQIVNFYSYHASVTVQAGNGKPTRPGVKYDQEKDYNMIITEPRYFSIFPFQWLAGSAASSLNQPFKVVLTENRAREYFGSLPFEEIIGKELIYDDSLHLKVSGIIKEWDKKTDLHFKDFISYSTINVSFLKNAIGFDNPDKPDSWGERTYAQTYVKLKKGTELSSFSAFVSAMLQNRRPADSRKNYVEIDLQPLSTLHFDPKYWDFYSRHAHLPTIFGLMAIAAFILILAVINFINLSTAQSLRRAREIGTRKVLGSERSGIVLQFLSETGIVVLCSVMLSLLTITPALSGFHAFVPPGLSPTSLWTINTLIFLTIVTILTIFLAGFYPATVLSSFSPALSLKGQTTGNANQKHYLRKSLIVFQFAISLFFIIGTMVIGGQIHYMLNKDPGFNKDGIVNINLRNINPNLGYTDADKDLFADKIRKISGVSMVSLDLFPAAIGFDPTFRFRDMATGEDIEASDRWADENYVPLYGLRILWGRNIAVPKNDTLTEFLINESCTRQLGLKQPRDAIGRKMAAGNMTGPIVGVIADFHSQSLQKPITPLFIMATKSDTRSVSVKMASSVDQDDNFKAALTGIERTWKEIYPSEKFEYSFFNEDIARFYDEEQKNSKIMNAAMAISLFISCMGLFGLATFTAQQLTKEIGIRKILGATVSGIVTLLTRQFLKLVLISIAIASPVAWYFMHKWLQDYAYRINISWPVFVMAGSLALFLALITVSFHAIRAAIANPVKSLRTE